MREPVLQDHRILVPALDRSGNRAFAPQRLSTLAELFQQRPPVVAPPTKGSRRADDKWRLVLPERTSSGPSPEAIQKALEPLLKLRDAPEPLFIQWQPTASALEQTNAFQERYAHLFYEEDMTVLLAGPLEDLPWAFQQQLGHAHSVGRLCFEQVEDYAAYAEKVVEVESHPAGQDVRSALLCAPRTDEATQLTHDVIMRKAADRLSVERQLKRTRQLFRREATVPAMLEELERLPARGLWVFGGHGRVERGWTDHNLGVPVDQGQLDFHPGRLSGMERCLEQGIAVLLTCFGAGRRGGWEVEPLFARSTEDRRGQELLAPLPTALLKMRRGPLAVVAHVDEVYLLGFGDQHLTLPSLEQQPGVSPFLSVVNALAQGQRISRALHPVRSRLRMRSQTLNDTLVQQRHLASETDPQAWRTLCNHWLVHHDAESWVVLGDPYAQLAPAKSTAR